MSRDMEDFRFWILKRANGKQCANGQSEIRNPHEVCHKFIVSCGRRRERAGCHPDYSANESEFCIMYLPSNSIGVGYNAPYLSSRSSNLFCVYPFSNCFCHHHFDFFISQLCAYEYDFTLSIASEITGYASDPCRRKGHPVDRLLLAPANSKNIGETLHCLFRHPDKRG